MFRNKRLYGYHTEVKDYLEQEFPLFFANIYVSDLAFQETSTGVALFKQVVDERINHPHNFKNYINSETLMMDNSKFFQLMVQRDGVIHRHSHYLPSENLGKTRPGDPLRRIPGRGTGQSKTMIHLMADLKFCIDNKIHFRTNSVEYIPKQETIYVHGKPFLGVCKYSGIFTWIRGEEKYSIFERWVVDKLFSQHNVLGSLNNTLPFVFDHIKTTSAITLKKIGGVYFLRLITSRTVMDSPAEESYGLFRTGDKSFIYLAIHPGVKNYFNVVVPRENAVFVNPKGKADIHLSNSHTTFLASSENFKEELPLIAPAITSDLKRLGAIADHEIVRRERKFNKGET